MMVGVNEYQRFVVEATGQDKRPFADVAVDPKLVFDKLRTSFKTFQDGHEKVYLVGGIVWVMANYQHPGDRGKYVKLTARDITWFEKAMRSSPNPLADFVAPAGLPPALATEMKLEIQKMKDVFPPQKLVAVRKSSRHFPKSWTLFTGRKCGSTATPRSNGFSSTSRKRSPARIKGLSRVPPLALVTGCRGSLPTTPGGRPMPVQMVCPKCQQTISSTDSTTPGRCPSCGFSSSDTPPGAAPVSPSTKCAGKSAGRHRQVHRS